MKETDRMIDIAKHYLGDYFGYEYRDIVHERLSSCTLHLVSPKNYKHKAKSFIHQMNHKARKLDRATINIEQQKLIVSSIKDAALLNNGSAGRAMALSSLNNNNKENRVEMGRAAFVSEMNDIRLQDQSFVDVMILHELIHIASYQLTDKGFSNGVGDVNNGFNEWLTDIIAIENAKTIHRNNIRIDKSKSHIEPVYNLSTSHNLVNPSYTVPKGFITKYKHIIFPAMIVGDFAPAGGREEFLHFSNKIIPYEIPF